MREFKRGARPWAVFLAVALGAACDENDPSTPDFSEESAEQVAEAAENVMGPVQDAAGLNKNLANAYGTLLRFGGPVDEVSPLLPFEMADRAHGMSLRGLATRSMSMSARSMSAPTAVLLPEAVLGMTFVWDVDSARYVFSDETGAPANGVRFVYYAVDPSGWPAEPLNALGYIDLGDASTDSYARLEIDAVRSAGNVKLADYFVQGAVTGNLQTYTVTLDSEGFVSDGTEDVDFDIRLVESENTATSAFTSTVDVSIENDAEDASIVVDFASEGDSAISTEDGSFVVRSGNLEADFSFVAEFDYQEDIYEIDGGLDFNGQEVVNFTGDPNDPDFSRPDGSALTGAEVHALTRMWLMFGATQLFVFEMLFPFYFLMLLSGF